MCGPWCLRDRTRLGSGCSFSRLASTGCRLKPLPFEGFCFLLFEDFSFLLLEGFSSHAGAENGMPLEGFSFGRLASTEVLRQVGTHAAQGLPFCTLSNNLHMFCLPFWAMNDGDADDNAADARDVSLKGGCLIPFVAGLCC